VKFSELKCTVKQWNIYRMFKYRVPRNIVRLKT